MLLTNADKIVVNVVSLNSAAALLLGCTVGVPLIVWSTLHQFDQG